MLKHIKNFLNKFKRLDWVFKHIILKISGKEDPLWDLNHFDKKVNKKTWENYEKILTWAEKCSQEAKIIESEKAYEKSADPIVIQGKSLLKKVNNEFYKKFADKNRIKLLIHVPSCTISPAGFSIFDNLVQSFNFLGIKTKALNWDEKIEDYLENFKPTVFLTSDDVPYLNRINWHSVLDYKKKNDLKLGLTASLDSWGNVSLIDRLKWGLKHSVDFYYSFEDNKYLLQRKEYEPYFLSGYKIFSIPFGANPLIYYPVPNIKRDLDYVFIGAKTLDKWPRFNYLEKILSKNAGFISGTNWKICGPNYRFSQEINRFIYARAKVGLNLHIDIQVRWANELNERTYSLAACGVPQLVDHPKILFKEFTEDCFFVGNSPNEYKELFYYILKNPEEATKRALKAQETVFSKYTTFHRAENFIKELISYFNLS